MDDALLKIACAELSGYRDGLEGLPYNATFTAGDENLAYHLWFSKARRVRSELVDQIDTLYARLHTVEQERDAAKAQCQFMEDAHELALEQLQALGPPVPACPHCERVNSRHLEPPSQSAVERCCPVTSRWQCRQCGMTFSEPTYYRQVTGQP